MSEAKADLLEPDIAVDEHPVKHAVAKGVRRESPAGHVSSSQVGGEYRNSSTCCQSSKGGPSLYATVPHGAL